MDNLQEYLFQILLPPDLPFDRGVILFDTGAGEDDDLVGQKIYFDIFVFVAPDTAFDVQGVLAVVRLAQKGGNLAVFHPHLQFVVIVLGEFAAASD